jgi:DtxR family transcriptional regulator, Mn-dependent transcriptional regulator
MTHSEENYLKVIYHLSLISPKGINTNAIAEMIDSKASSVTDMVKKLAEKEMVHYKKYQGVSLTLKGLHQAKMIVRKHRLWEVFLVDKLDFSWDEVHEIAEELEHIKSEKLINKLDAFLGFPKEDPHGDPIPNETGHVDVVSRKLLSESTLNKKVVCMGVKDNSASFLQFLDKNNIAIGTEFEIVDKVAFDSTLVVKIHEQEKTISHKIAQNLYVKELSHV